MAKVKKVINDPLYHDVVIVDEDGNELSSAEKGGKGSGNWGHGGLPGVHGGSSPRESIGAPSSDASPAYPFTLEEGVSGRKKMVMESAKEAFDIARGVHGDVGGLHEINLVNASYQYPSGKFVSDFTGTPKRIEFGTSCKDRDNTIRVAIHEYGHWLDKSRADIVASTKPKDHDEYMERIVIFRKVTDTIKSSKAYEIFEKLERGEVSMRLEVRNWQYYAQGKELFARAYYQYVVMKSKSTALSMDRDYYRALADPVISADGKISFSSQWGKNDFAPIAKAFDDLFSMIRGE